MGWWKHKYAIQATVKSRGKVSSEFFLRTLSGRSQIFSSLEEATIECAKRQRFARSPHVTYRPVRVR